MVFSPLETLYNSAMLFTTEEDLDAVGEGGHKFFFIKSIISHRNAAGTDEHLIIKSARLSFFLFRFIFAYIYFLE